MKVVLYLDTSIFGFGIAIRALGSNEETLYKVYKSDRSSANLKLSSLVLEALESIGSSVEAIDSVVVSKGPALLQGFALVYLGFKVFVRVCANNMVFLLWSF